MRPRVAWLLVLALVIGCGERTSTPPAGSGGSPDEGNGAGQKTFRIAVIPKGTTHDFWKSVHFGAEQAAEELGGVEVIWKGPENEKDKEGQIKIVDSFITQRVDGICLAPIDRDAFVPVVNRAKRRNIPTVIFDSALSDESDIVSHIATDNRNGGVLAGEHMAKILGGKGDVILLRYQAGSESTEQREAGFLDTLKKFPGITILSESQRVGSKEQEALRISDSLLLQHKNEVDGAFTVCEPNNKGMLRALENIRLAGKVKFIGFDSDPRVAAALRDGNMHGVVLQDPVRMGYLAVKTMVEHLTGQQVEKRIYTGEYLATPKNMNEPKMQELLFPKQFQ